MAEDVLAHLGLVRMVALPIWRRRRRIDLDDLIQAGTLGLMWAAERFDPALGFAFSTYAARCIRGAILTHLRREMDLVRVPAHVVGDEYARLRSLLRPGRLHRDRRARDRGGAGDVADARSGDGFGRADDRDQVGQLLGRLEGARREVVEGLLAGKDYAEIARERGCTRSNVWQIGEDALEQLRTGVRKGRRVDPEAMAKAQDARARGLSAGQTAKLLGVAPGVVRWMWYGKG